MILRTDAKYLINLLNILATNEFTIKDTLDAVSRMKIPTKLFNDGFWFVSFDVKSLFTNIPLTKTINIFYNEYMIPNLYQLISPADRLKNFYFIHVLKLSSVITVIITNKLNGFQWVPR